MTIWDHHFGIGVFKEDALTPIVDALARSEMWRLWLRSQV